MEAQRALLLVDVVIPLGHMFLREFYGEAPADKHFPALGLAPKRRVSSRLLGAGIQSKKTGTHNWPGTVF